METESQERAPSSAGIVVGGVVVTASAAVGALGGWLWYQWWGPPNKGSIYETLDGRILWLDPTDKGIAHQFNGPAQYAIIGIGLGLVLGVLAALLGRRQALVALGSLIVGSALAAFLAWGVGNVLSPPDPQQYAKKSAVCTEAPCKEYDAAIEVSGWTPFLCWPLGALAGFSLTVVVAEWIGSFRGSQAAQRDAGTWLAAPGARQEP
ncbi:hypothetical protein F0U44_14780 [Nocardioides humilatus]|uniref:DUF2567 domain-containing protein n=1 Tax=Nocardioides humilatus TaxID=2607660 RepID=A0A5B1LBS6_9ACTN|nr:hypothetical protein [Nocardioides humilatus]KAA1417906.1 hypothetical protein F0U44_14780 [Nocardioides humilatus]